MHSKALSTVVYSIFTSLLCEAKRRFQGVFSSWHALSFPLRLRTSFVLVLILNKKYIYINSCQVTTNLTLQRYN